MNSVNIIGRATKDPSYDSVDKRCEFTLAVDNIEARNEVTDFIPVIVTGSQAEVCIRYIRKGFLTGISGKVESYHDQLDNNPNSFKIRVRANRVSLLQWPDRSRNEENNG
jgi:single-strand DNA-binding protein